MPHQDLNSSRRRSKGTPSQNGTPRTTINDLPNEILILIFENLSSSDLVNGVYHVCQRWQDIASHHSVWVNSQVFHSSQTALKKVLSIAPVIATLYVMFAPITRSDLEALRKSTTRIRNLYISVDHIQRRDSHLLIPILDHLSKNLEILVLDVGYNLEWMWFNTGMSSNECSLGSMPKLKRLTLMGDILLRENISQLLPDSPLLEKLDVRFFSNIPLSTKFALNCASNLIIKNKENLKELFFLGGVDLHSVVQCRSLKVIYLPFKYIQIVSHLPQIETLVVRFDCDLISKPPKTWTRPKNLEQLALDIRTQPTPDCVRFLREIRPLSLTLYEQDDSFISKEVEEYFSPDIVTLTLCCNQIRYQEITEVILKNKTLLSNLKYLRFGPCVPRDLPKSLSELRRAFPSITIEFTEKPQRVTA